ncbi:MAG: c-type cytochrome, partial [Gammaproteobacteria bacterium]|nr:c-type cytochrome [Gammaproteobacteria bacterium]
TKAKIALGKQLFFDTELLGLDSSISCNSCHNLSQGGSDNNSISIGQNGKKTRRSSPGLWNIGLQTVLYWDGRSTSLELQTLDHLRDPVISNWISIGALVTKLSQSSRYQRAFKEAFTDSSSEENPVTGINLARAIASFERSLMTGKSPFDRYITGDKSALSASAIRGITSFNNAGCLACHFGVNFAGPAPGPALKMGDGFYELFPNNLGTDYEKQYKLADDLGRYEFTGLPDERYMWRVPPLRNIELTAPYFHNGSVRKLEDAVRVMAETQLGKKLSNSTVNDITEFLKSLTTTIPSSNKLNVK